MKRFITLTLALCMILSCFTITSSAMTKKPKKYTKVKTATYQKYKKAYKNQKILKDKITDLEIQLAYKQADYEDAMDQYEVALETAEKLQTELDNANSMNRWVWSSLKSMGITYRSKTWTIPNTYPESFIIDGVKYVVVIPAAETPEGDE